MKYRELMKEYAVQTFPGNEPVPLTGCGGLVADRTTGRLHRVTSEICGNWNTYRIHEPSGYLSDCGTFSCIAWPWLVEVSR